MAASFYVNTMQVDFESVLAMEHTGLAKMFKSLEDIGLKRFLEASGSVYEVAVVEFFANAKVIARTIGLVGFLDIPSKTVAEMQMKFSGTDVPFRAPNKKKEMKMEYRLLHDIVAKTPCAKSGSFDVVTTEKFELMVAISDGLKVKWAQVLFQYLMAMVNMPTKQSQAGFRVLQQVNNTPLPIVLRRRLVRLRSWRRRLLRSQRTGRKRLFQQEEEEVVESMPVDARSQAAPAKSKSGTSSDEDSRPMAKLKKGGVNRKLVVEPSDSESNVSVPPVLIRKKNQTKKTKKVRPAAHQTASQPGPVLDIPAEADKTSTADGPEATMETTPEVEKKVDGASTTTKQECGNRTDMEPITNEGTIVVRSGPEQPDQHSITSASKGVHAPIQIKEINWVTHFLSKIDPAAKGKELLQFLARPNPLEEHYLMVLQGIREKVDHQIHLFDQLRRLQTGYRLNRVKSMSLVEAYAKIEDHLTTKPLLEPAFI
ncbi:hypothetical protein F511_44218 [Dorcoceras hygrometricum]|uniref:Uncharacterized protein n=1 Tax=Dorcoceras hygrometricum TaxID=472368 RepID=A0A2Z7CJ63_9LAMI|nr:hypothetical protein F511_44218 [Dorcoceras hygrometricum]